MNVVDSSRWLEYFAEGKNARFFAPPIEATARSVGATLWTQDADIEGREGVRYVAF